MTARIFKALFYFSLVLTSNMTLYAMKAQRRASQEQITSNSTNTNSVAQVILSGIRSFNMSAMGLNAALHNAETHLIPLLENAILDRKNEQRIWVMPGKINSIAVAGQKFVYSLDSGQVYTREFGSVESEQIFEGAQEAVCSPDGSTIACKCEDSFWVMHPDYLASSPNVIKVSESINAKVMQMVFINNGEQLVTLEEHYAKTDTKAATTKINLYNVNNGQLTWQCTEYVIANKGNVLKSVLQADRLGQHVQLVRYFAHNIIVDNYDVSENALGLCSNIADIKIGKDQPTIIPLHNKNDHKDYINECNLTRTETTRHILTPGDHSIQFAKITGNRIEFATMETMYDKLRDQKETERIFFPKSIVSLDQNTLVAVGFSGKIIKYALEQLAVTAEQAGLTQEQSEYFVEKAFVTDNSYYLVLYDKERNQSMVHAYSLSNFKDTSEK